MPKASGKVKEEIKSNSGYGHVEDRANLDAATLLVEWETDTVLPRIHGIQRRGDLTCSCGFKEFGLEE